MNMQNQEMAWALEHLEKALERETAPNEFTAWLTQAFIPQMREIIAADGILPSQNPLLPHAKEYDSLTIELDLALRNIDKVFSFGGMIYEAYLWEEQWQMTTGRNIHLVECLRYLEYGLKASHFWQDSPPPAAELTPENNLAAWLQWVFLPEAREIVAIDGVLPNYPPLLPLAEEQWEKAMYQSLDVNSLSCVVGAIDEVLERGSMNSVSIMRFMRRYGHATLPPEEDYPCCSSTEEFFLHEKSENEAFLYQTYRSERPPQEQMATALLFLEKVLRRLDWWQEKEDKTAGFAAWLQWEFIPQMTAKVAAGEDLSSDDELYKYVDEHYQPTDGNAFHLNSLSLALEKIDNLRTDNFFSSNIFLDRDLVLRHNIYFHDPVQVTTFAERLNFLLLALEGALRALGWWQKSAPAAKNLNFAEWLQWIYIPKIQFCLFVYKMRPRKESNLLVLAKKEWPDGAENCTALFVIIEAIDNLINENDVNPTVWTNIQAQYLSFKF